MEERRKLRLEKQTISGYTEKLEGQKKVEEDLAYLVPTSEDTEQFPVISDPGQ